MSTAADRRTRTLVTTAVVLALVGLASLVPGEIRWELAWERRGQFALGLGLTAAISFGALIVGLTLGTLSGLAFVSRSVALRQLARTYVELVRGTPFLVQLFLWYVCLASVLRLKEVLGFAEAAVVGGFGLGVFAGAYVCEIVRAAVHSIDRGQWEAARSLGLGHRATLWRVILPQCRRRLLPPLTGEAVSLVKESSLLSIFGVAELTYQARALQSHHYETWAAYLPLALLYLVITLPLSMLTRRLERSGARPEPLPVEAL